MPIDPREIKEVRSRHHEWLKTATPEQVRKMLERIDPKLRGERSSQEKVRGPRNGKRKKSKQVNVA